MFRLVPRRWQDDVTATADEVILADGTLMTVRRGNLIAAKELLAARKAAERRAAARSKLLDDIQELNRRVG